MDNQIQNQKTNSLPSAPAQLTPSPLPQAQKSSKNFLLIFMITGLLVGIIVLAAILFIRVQTKTPSPAPAPAVQTQDEIPSFETEEDISSEGDFVNPEDLE